MAFLLQINFCNFKISHYLYTNQINYIENYRNKKILIIGEAHTTIINHLTRLPKIAFFKLLFVWSLLLTAHLH